jgi:GST-like protein
MIDFYTWFTPNGRKVALMLEETSLDYTTFPININNKEQFQPHFLAISPNNRIPAIIDRDNDDYSLFESGATILQYLGRKTGLYYPSDEQDRVEVEQWLMWQMGGLGPMLGQNHHFGKFAKEKIPYAIDRYVTETQRLYGVLNKQLIGQKYVAGEYSIADMAILPWVLRYEWQQIVLDDYPYVKEYIERLTARPAIQRALSIKV